jgi:phage FluMu protein Com
MVSFQSTEPFEDMAPLAWSKKKEIPCDHCEVHLIGTEMKWHFQAKHLWGVFTCHHCKAVLHYPRDLVEHTRGHSISEIDGGAVAKCPTCKDTKETESFEEHYR